MLALLSVWIGLLSFGLAVVMFFWRRAFNDVNVWCVLWLGAPAAICFAGLVLWAHRKDKNPEPAVLAQRTQCKVAIALAIAAAALVYVLVIRAQEVPAGLLPA